MNSIYNTLTVSTLKKEIGCYPQCTPKPINKPIDWHDSDRSYWSLDNNNHPSDIVEFEFELEKRAKLTDIISPSNIKAVGFLLNNKVKEIIEQYALGEHSFHESIVTFKGLNYKYYWLHIIQNDLNNIDYNKSKFVLTDLAYTIISDIDILNKEDLIYKGREAELKHILADKFCLNQTNNLDLYYFPWISKRRVFISEELSLELLLNKVSGMDIIKQNNFAG